MYPIEVTNADRATTDRISDFGKRDEYGQFLKVGLVFESNTG